MAIIVRRYAAMVFATSRRVTGNPSDAEDVAQECFLKLSAIERRGDSLAALLHTMATRLSLNAIRGNARRRSREAAFAAVSAKAVEPDWDDIQPLIDEAIGTLPEERRVPLIRHYLQGETHAEIARDLGLSRAAISQRVAKGVAEVRSELRRRNVAIPVTLLGSMLATLSTQAVPPDLAASLGRVAVSGATSAGPPPITAVSLMPAWSIWAAAGALAAAVAAVGLASWDKGGPVEPAPHAESAKTLAAPDERPETSDTNTQTATTEAPATVVSPSAEPSPGIAGILMDPSGVPRSDTALRRDKPPETVRTGIDGSFLLPADGGDTTWFAMDLSQFGGVATIFRPSAYTATPPFTVELNCGVVEVFGRIVAPSERGIPGKAIEFHFQSAAGEEFIVARGTTSDAQGYYHAVLPACDGHTLRAQAASQDVGGSSWTPSISLAADSFYLHLPDIQMTEAPEKSPPSVEPPYQNLSGSVQDAAGNPIAKARLCLMDGEGNWVRTKTGQDGRWVRPVPGNWARASVEVRHPAFVPSRLRQESYVPSMASLRDGNGVVTLERGTPINGIVRDRGGRPVPGAEVHLGPAAGTVRTDGDGRFTTPCLPDGEHTITLSHSAYAATANTIHVPPPSPTTQLELDSGGTIMGHVVNEQGEPVPGLRVRANQLFPDGAIPVSLGIADTTRKDGTFRIEQIPTQGKIRITIEAPRGDASGLKDRYLPINTFALTPRDTPFEVVLHEPPLVVGKVMDSKTGEPVPRFTLETQTVRDPAAPTTGIYLTSFPRNHTEVSDAAGQFAYRIKEGYVDLVPNATVALSIQAEGYFTVSSPTIFVGSDVPDMTIYLTPASPIEGVVLGPKGQPLGGVQVAWADTEHRLKVQRGRVLPFREEREIVTSDSVGRFAVQPLGPGGQLVAVCDDGHALIDATSFTSGSTIQLQPWGHIRGTLYHGSEVWTGALIDIRNYRPSGEHESTPLIWGDRDTTRPDGSFTFSHMPALPMQVGRSVFVQHRQELWPGDAVFPEPGRETEIVLGTELGAVAGSIEMPKKGLVTDSWKPENIRIVVTPDATSADEYAPETATGLAADGTFLLQGLAPGNYQVTATLYGDDVTYPIGLGSTLASKTVDVTIGGTNGDYVELPGMVLAE